MLYIAIYENNLDAIHEIDSFVSSWAINCYREVKKTFFVIDKDLIEHCTDGENPVDIILMNIKNDSSQDMDAVRMIRSRNTKVIIIIITECRSFVYDAFELDVFRYIIKDSLKSKLASALNSAAEKITNKHRNFIFSAKGMMWKLSYNKIMYFESRKRIIHIHMETRDTKKFYDKIKNIETILDPYQFIRCHQSYIVNVRYIKGFISNEIILSGGQKIPVSTSRKGSLKEIIINQFK